MKSHKISTNGSVVGAVDLGGTKMAVGVVDATGLVLARCEAPTLPEEDYACGLERLVALLRGVIHEAGIAIGGIGIGSTGPVNPFTGEFGDVDFLPTWRKSNPALDLARIFGVRTALENDADAGALAEAAWGAGRGKSRLVYITVGTGIGGSVIVDGRLYRGVDGAHPEIGHHVIDPTGPPCSCGFRGCWEALAAGPAVEEWFKSRLPNGDERRTDSSFKTICELASKGDVLAREMVEREAYYLGLGLANLINLFAPDVIVLAGGVMKSSALLLPGMREVIRQGCRFVPAEKTELTLASLGENANLIGAARVWYHRFGAAEEFAPAVAQT